MATKIETLKKPNGDQVLPRTRAKAVSMENGTTVEATIGDMKEQLNAKPTVHYGTTEPTDDIGVDGDIYIMYEV